MNSISVVPSILSANFYNLSDELKKLKNEGINLIHFDVMDNHYAPNLTFGAPLLESLVKGDKDLSWDIHLCTYKLNKLIPIFAKAGAYQINIHPEATNHLNRDLNLIKSFNLKVGLVLNPTSSISWLDYTIDLIDNLMLMSVNLGFSGQKFITNSLKKIKKAKLKLDEYYQQTGKRINLAVDGGVTTQNVASIVASGADTIVAGSAIFDSNNYANSISKLRLK